jgi:uncharacterized protein
MKFKSAIAQEIWETGKSINCPVFDMHAHAGPFSRIYFPNTAPGNIVRRMDRAGVKFLAYAHHSGLCSPDMMNRDDEAIVTAFPGRLGAYLTVNPHYPHLIERDLALLYSLPNVYLGLKLHAMHGLVYTHPRYRSALCYANSRGLPVLLHTWNNDPKCNGPVVRQLAEDYPDARFILGHSIHPNWEEAGEIAARYPNAYLETCAVLDERLGIMRHFINTAGPTKILFGTDIPWFGYPYYMGAVIAEDLEDEELHAIFHGNAEALLEGSGLTTFVTKR